MRPEGVRLRGVPNHLAGLPLKSKRAFSCENALLTPYARKSSAKKMLAPAYVPTHEYAVSSAMRSLTSGFGMEPGVPSSLWEPTNLVALGIALWRNFVRLPKGL